MRNPATAPRGAYGPEGEALLDDRVRVPSSPSKVLAVRGVYEVKKYSRSSFVLLEKQK